MTTKRPLYATVLMYLALAGYLIFLGFPLLWLLSASFKSTRELNSLAVNLIPQQWDFGNYIAALERQNLITAAGNSVLVSIVTMIVAVLLSMPMAYALARLKGRLRAAGTVWILVSQVFPTILIIIPLFLVLRSLQLNDTLFGLILVYVTFTMPFTLWMLQGYVAAIPPELEEAAEMDGAGRFTILRTVILPLLVPGLVATAMFTFVSAWNEFFLALVLIQSPELYTLPIALRSFLGAEGQTQLGPLAAGAILATIPSLIIFGILQKKLTGGMLAGAVKG
ncbi:carbohydrate ABC transporter permease [Microbacterium sp. NE2HP2]|uniref:Carbohydrate ABC transporter permease n=1 Tax=Microbacterium plantarum TaxID=1816425 RepID=A0ABV5EPA5_9MICO|nr:MULTISPECIES: carbohydrate ABC transporter permease [Microbacterium]MCZ4068744.1 carbohydrate ABC transporter permease [Microbacterium sp. H37-C3]MDD7945428.1 carbohydrate ABC transporter permease [Microbacterium plantarum]RKE64704.1 carbohydrate ABC transporter membrane protein 2 (CUT1 family) [Microbacterium sp. AG238]WHE36126.1 carbohydrate ABC transporter permease [Microbacterium sp. BDGP8]WJM15706.1 carbohydrate ABC transporter permease [Microbacterium arborescens]